MRILYLAGNPVGNRPLQVDKELNLLREKIDQVATRQHVDIWPYSDVRLEDLPQIVARVAPDVIHFSAHGDEDGIELAMSNQMSSTLGGKQLAQILAALGARPKLILVNACSSAAVAERLAEAATEFSIGVDAPITNMGARIFAATLYQRLADGASVADAFAAGAGLLDAVDDGKVQVKLFPEGCETRARRSFIGNPLRILAYFPDVERWLDNNHTKPHKGFDPYHPGVQFGLAGLPPSTRQATLFTDDETVRPKGKQSLGDARGWFEEVQPIKGQTWFDRYFAYYGDMHWYASITTGDQCILSCSASTIDALERYYFVEQWRGELPAEISQLVRQALDNLKANDGARGR